MLVVQHPRSKSERREGHYGLLAFCVVDKVISVFEGLFAQVYFLGRVAWVAEFIPIGVNVAIHSIWW